MIESPPSPTREFNNNDEVNFVGPEYLRIIPIHTTTSDEKFKMAHDAAIAPAAREVIHSQTQSPYPKALNVLRRPQFISVSLIKQSPDEAIGISIQKEGNHHPLQVAGILKHGLFHAATTMDESRQELNNNNEFRFDSWVCIGDIITSINGINVKDKTAKYATKLIQKATNFVTLDFQVPSHEMSNPQVSLSILHKPQMETVLGLGLVHHKGTIRIARKSNQDGLASKCRRLLHVGDTVLSINGTAAHQLDVKTVVNMMRTAVGPLTICTNRPLPFERPEFISATVYKQNPSDSVGLGFLLDEDEQDSDGVIRIASIDPLGLFIDSPLRIGDVVLSINHKVCSSASEYVGLIQSLPSKIHIVVKVEGGIPNRVASMVSKQHSRDALGIGVEQRTRRVRIARIADTGLLVDSLLNVDDTVLSINDIPCCNRLYGRRTTPMTAVMASNIIKQAKRHVTIVAKTKMQSGVVVSKLS